MQSGEKREIESNDLYRDFRCCFFFFKSQKKKKKKKKKKLNNNNNRKMCILPIRQVIRRSDNIICTQKSNQKTLNPEEKSK